MNLPWLHPLKSWSLRQTRSGSAIPPWSPTLAADTDLAQVTANGLSDYASLSEIDKAGFVATFMAFPSCSQDAFIKRREGSPSPELWPGWEPVMVNLVIPPGGQAVWKERGYLYGKKFHD